MKDTRERGLGTFPRVFNVFGVSLWSIFFFRGSILCHFVHRIRGIVEGGGVYVIGVRDSGQDGTIAKGIRSGDVVHFFYFHKCGQIFGVWVFVQRGYFRVLWRFLVFYVCRYFRGCVIFLVFPKASVSGYYFSDKGNQKIPFNFMYFRRVP